MLTLPGSVQGSYAGEFSSMLNALSQARQSEIQRDISEHNARFFEAEADKLDGWADDLKLGLEREIKDLGSADQRSQTRRAYCGS